MANLIVYYSRKGQNYWNGSIVDLAKGNTERVAEFVQKAVGGDLFEIETVREYSKDYMTCTEEAKAELREGARPELKKYLDSIDSYDTIFVGYNWNTAYYYNNVITGDGHGKASECIRCGKCEKVCPQHLPIRELLQKVAAAFEK